MKLRNELIKGAKIIIRNVLIVVNAVLTCLPVKRHTYLFESFNGKAVSDNPLAIYRQLVRDHPAARQRAYFGIKPKYYAATHAKYPQVRLLRRFMPKWLWVCARAQFWVFNARMPTWWRKNLGTVYLQTWHGTPLKKLGLDMTEIEMPGTNLEKYQRNFAKETRRWRALIAPNQYSQRIFRHAFAFHHQFLATGYPRNDVLYRDNQPDRIRQLKRKLVGDPSARIILYAPTWRDDDYLWRGAYRFQLKFSLKEFFRHVTPNTILIIRPHYLIRNRIDVQGYRDRVKIMADCDISELYLIADLLITDYSSVMFDYANLDRPMLFFSYDLVHYAKKLRGFYFNYRSEVPGPVVQTTDQLDHALDTFRKFGKFPGYTKRMRQFRRKFCDWESANSAEKVVNWLEEMQNE